MAGSVVRELITLWGFDVDKKPLQELDAGINSIKSSLKSVGVAVAATAAGIGFLLNEAGEQEQTNVAFETMIGNAELAHKTIADLQEFAAKTPFTIPGIERNAKQLLGMGIEVTKLIPTLKALGDVSSGLSVPLERIALNYGQIKAQGKLTGRELRDFAVAGVPLLATLAKQFNKTEAEVTSMVSAGKVGFDDVEKAFISMTSKGGRFEDLMIKQSKTLKGLVSNLQDFGIMFSRELGQEILPLAKELVGEFIDWLQVNRKIIMGKFKEFLKTLVGFFKDLIKLVVTFKKGLDGVVSAFGGWNKAMQLAFEIFTAIAALKMVTGLGLIAQAAYGLAAAWRTMGAAALWAQIKMALIPLAIGAVIASIALIAEDIVAFSQGRDSVFGRMIEGVTEVFNQLSEKFKTFSTIGQALIGFLLTPVRTIVNGFQGLLTIIDMIRGKVGFLKGLKNIGMGIANTMGMTGVDTLSGAMGMADNMGAATDQVNAGNNAFKALSGPMSKPGNGTQKNVNVNSKVDMNLNVTGMSKEDAENLITGQWGEKLDGVLRSAVRDGESQIER